MVNVLLLKMLREPKVQIDKILNIAISPWNGKLQSRGFGTTSNFMLAENTSDAIVSNLKQMGCIVSTVFDNEKLSKNPSDEDIFEYHNSKERNVDVLVQFCSASNSSQKNTLGIEIIHSINAKDEFAERIAKAIAEVSGLHIRRIDRSSNIEFFSKSDKPVFMICITLSKKDEESYDKKFDEICIAIAEALCGKQLSATKLDESSKSAGYSPKAK